VASLLDAGGTSLTSLGHSTLPLEAFLALLAAEGIERLVDVRRFPVSRRHPHFARESLALSLPRAGVQYVHLAELGGHREEGPDSPHTALPPGPLRGYAQHMATPAFVSALAHLVALARARRTAVMCAEARWSDCHRRLLCDHLVLAGARVRHVRVGAEAEPHLPTPEARFVDGRLVYAPTTRQGSLFD